MAYARLKKQKPEFKQIELTIENQEELDVLNALLGCISARDGLKKLLPECTRVKREHSNAHTEAQFTLFNALASPIVARKGDR